MLFTPVLKCKKKTTFRRGESFYYPFLLLRRSDHASVTKYENLKCRYKGN